MKDRFDIARGRLEELRPGRRWHSRSRPHFVVQIVRIAGIRLFCRDRTGQIREYELGPFAQHFTPADESWRRA